MTIAERPFAKSPVQRQEQIGSLIRANPVPTWVASTTIRTLRHQIFQFTHGKVWLEEYDIVNQGRNIQSVGLYTPGKTMYSDDPSCEMRIGDFEFISNKHTIHVDVTQFNNSRPNLHIYILAESLPAEAPILESRKTSILPAVKSFVEIALLMSQRFDNMATTGYSICHEVDFIQHRSSNLALLRRDITP